jgi:aldehyde:ferredoxin oxidoreductase
MKDLLDTGARLWLLMRGMTNLMGATSKDDRLPKRILTPLNEGMAAGSVPDIDLMLREYYEHRGLDKNGIPSKQVLDKAGLSDLAQKLSGE